MTDVEALADEPGTTRTSKRKAVIAGLTGVGLVVAGLLLLRGCGDDQPQTVRAVAAGDMVCDPTDPGVGSEDDCKSQEVSDIAVGLAPDALLGLGDYVYEVPKSDTYASDYAPSWGRLP